MLKLFISGIIAFGAFQALASQNNDINELLEICETIEANPQIRDFESVITCRGHYTSWVEESEEQRQLSTDYIVKSEFAMKGDRYLVDQIAEDVEGPHFLSTCTNYKEMRYDYEPISVTLTSCEELRAVKEVGRDAYCSDVLKNAQTANPDGEATGRTMSTCDDHDC